MTCGIFPDQGLNPCLLHWQANPLPLSHQGSPSCVNFCCIAKWFSYTYMYINIYLSLFIFFFVIVFHRILTMVPFDWLWFPLLHSQALFLHSMCNSLHMLIPNNHPIPFLPDSPFSLATTSQEHIFSGSEEGQSNIQSKCVLHLKNRNNLGRWA